MTFKRYNGTVEPFAKDATGSNRTVFGDTLQSDDIDDNLNTHFRRGWEIVGINDNPTKQDFNGLAYTVSNLVAYLYQQGIAEYNSSQKYMENSIVIASDGKLYRSLTGDETTPNMGNDPLTDRVSWEYLEKPLFVETIEDMIALDSTHVSSIIVTDERRGGIFNYDSTRATENDGGTIFNGWVRENSNPLEPEWFGAVGDGVTDDTVAIQKTYDAAGSGSTVLFKSKVYKVTDRITINDRIATVGKDFGGRASTIHYYNKNIAGTKGVFYVTNTDTSFTNIQIIEIGGYALSPSNNVAAIYLAPCEVGKDVDVDSWLSGVMTSNTYHGIYVQGRGLNINSALMTQHEVGVVLDYPDISDWSDGDYGFETYAQGFRGHYIFDVRFHSCSVAVTNSGTNKAMLKGLQMNSIHLDTGGTVFSGLLRQSMISDVTVINQYEKCFIIDSGSEDYTISDCILECIDDDIFTSTGTLVANSCNIAMYFPGSQKNVVLSNITIARPTLNAIAFMDASVAENITIKNINIKDVGFTITDKQALVPISINSTSGVDITLDGISYHDSEAYGDTLPYIILINSAIEKEVSVSNISKNVNCNNTSRPLSLMATLPISNSTGWSRFMTVAGTDNVEALEFDAYNDGESLKIGGYKFNKIYLDMVDNGYLLPLQTETHYLGSPSFSWKNVNALAYNSGDDVGQTGTFTTSDGKTITVKGGIIIGIA